MSGEGLIVTQGQFNRLYNSKNPNQGEHKRVLCVCSAGLLRSPTAALVLSQEPFNYNTRAAGIEESYALVPVDIVLLGWAELVVFMTQDHYTTAKAKFGADNLPNHLVLGIPDNFAYRDPELMQMIKDCMKSHLLAKGEKL